MRLRDCPSERFNWRDLLVFVRHLSVHSVLFRKLYPERAGWDDQNMLLAMIADELRWLHWAKTVAAQEGGDPPDPIPRPGYLPKPRREGSKPKKPMALDDRSRASLAAQAGREADDPDRSKKLTSLFRSGGV